ncbi:hypothetical protein [Methylomonas albis]|nr:hypothetical protein [Methylomonas albis]
MSLKSKSRTRAVALPIRPSISVILVAWLAASLAIACVAYLSQVSEQPPGFAGILTGSAIRSANKDKHAWAE